MKFQRLHSCDLRGPSIAARAPGAARRTPGVGQGAPLLWALALGGCTGAVDQGQAEAPTQGAPGALQQPRAPAPVGRTPQSKTAEWQPETFRKFVLRSQNIVVALPQGDSFVPLRRRGTWSGLGHEPTKSEIWIRHTEARRTVTASECAAEARLSWEVLRDGAPVVESRPLQRPKDYLGTVDIVLIPQGGGRVEMLAAGIGRCLAVVFVTGALPGVPERLSVAATEVADSLRVPSIGERGMATRLGPTL